MTPKRLLFGLRSAVKPALAGLLVALLAWLVTFASTSSFHQALHADAPGDSSHCVICLFAQSHVDTATVGELSVLFIGLCMGLAPLARQVALTSLDLRLAPSRAPPRFSVPTGR